MVSLLSPTACYNSQQRLSDEKRHSDVFNSDESIDEGDRCLCRRSIQAGFGLLEQQLYTVPGCLKGVLGRPFPMRDAHLRII